MHEKKKAILFYYLYLHSEGKRKRDERQNVVV